MVSIGFNLAGSFDGPAGGPDVLNNPTSLQFGPDGRLYVAEQNGDINAFTVAVQDGQYVATAHETLLLPDGGGVVKSIQNHNDDGSLSNDGNRQVTGLVVAGTAENPVLYISSSDPRIAQNGEVGLDTNSGVVTQVTWTGSEWEAVDLIRGLPRSEENHAVNGLQLSPDGDTLYLAVGGNTNNGAPSQFFSYTAEYALSGTVIEIDLADIDSRPVLTDNAPGQDGRQYVYDLPTLDDPTIPNVTDGVGEDEFGLDEAGPWGGNDGFNQAILPADAPFRIFADGLRNHYDLVLTESGQLYTVDNGSNGGLGGNPLDANGTPTDETGAGEATNTPNDPGPGDPEPLFLLEDGVYYGHPNPIRSNQDLEWVIYDDNGNPDTSITPNSFPNVADLVPDSVDIQNGFVIDPSQFTGDADRLTQSGIRIERDSPETNALTTLGSSSNGLVEYTADAFDGALQGALVVAQFTNGNVTLLNLNADGTALEPLIDPGIDGLLGTDDDEVIDEDGIFSLITGQGQPLDVTVGPDGTLWVAEFGPDNINVFAPTDLVLPGDDDFDDDGIPNVNDPFIRDDTNGGSVVVLPGHNLLWDFDADQDNNLPGPDGYATGLTGVMIDGVTDFEEFFQQPSSQPGQLINLDNIKFATAAGGGTNVVEFVSNGDPIGGSNNAEYLFHTGVTVDPTVDTFTIQWSLFNPAAEFTGPFQQLGGYIGTGDQSNYLKIVAIQSDSGEIQVLLEDDDTVISSSFIQADDLFTVPPNQQIFLELEIDPSGATATPTVTYETGEGNNTTTVAGAALDLTGTTILEAVQGNYTVNGQTSGLAVGLFSSNNGQATADTFQAIFDGIEITADGSPPVPELSIADVGIDEEAETATFTVSLSEPAVDAVTVDYSTADGTAIADEDYSATSDTLTFAPGETTQTFTVDILDDTLAEARETFSVDLANPVGATLADESGTATIFDDDADILYRINVGGETVSALDGLLDWSEDTNTNPSPFRVGNGGNNIFTVDDATIDLSAPNLHSGALVDTLFQSERFDIGSAPTMQWEFAVDPGSEVEVRLYFAEIFDGITGADQRVFDIALEGTVPDAFDDIDVFETTGQLNTALVLSSTAVVEDGSVSLEFLNNIENPAIKAIEIVQIGGSTEPLPEVSIGDVTVNEADGNATFAVSLSEASDADITVDFATADGTATADSDYAGDTGTVTFAAGETSQTITIDITDDAEVEADETFTVELSDASGAAIADGTATGTIVDNDILPEPDGFLFSLQSSETLNGLNFTPRDIVLFDGTDFSLFFDGSDLGLIDTDIGIDAFDVISENEILFSFDETVSIPGVGTVDDSDVVEFTATNLGANTAGTFALYFDGSDVGLSSNGEDIDALTALPDGSLLISTTGALNAGGLSTNDEDVVMFTPTSLGDVTAGTFSPFVDGSDIGLDGEDIDGFSIDAAGDFFFTNIGKFSVSGVSGTDEDIFAFAPSSTGNNTSGSFASELLFDWSDFGFPNNDLKGIDLTFDGASSDTWAESPIRLEVVEADSIINFRPEAIAAASSGGAYSLVGGAANEFGSATFGFDEAPGAYNIIVGTFDENDGLAQFTVELNDIETGTTTEIGTLELDDDLGSNLPNAQTAISPVVASGVALTPGDSLTVTGFEDGFEFARLDYIELTPVNI